MDNNQFWLFWWLFLFAFIAVMSFLEYLKGSE